jgi:hypothetical protein
MYNRRWNEQDTHTRSLGGTGWDWIACAGVSVVQDIIHSEVPIGSKDREVKPAQCIEVMLNVGVSIA